MVSSMTGNRNFIIYAPSYKEDSGGIIVLHKLCHMLNEMGHKAYLWPDRIGSRSSIWKLIRNYLKPKKYITDCDFYTPIAGPSTLNENSVVIYAETVPGNPLKASKVVRWLLHKPGFHTGVAEYGKGELIFAFDDYCIEPGYGIDAANKLFVLALNKAYNMDGVEAHRSGACYMMRKGKGRTLVHDTDDAILVDGLNHQEMAEVFKKSKYFYCYDEATLYSQYAALCGCVSVVIPENYESRDDWVESKPSFKYGVAYGLNDFEHAIATQNEVATYFKGLENQSQATVDSFVNTAQRYFFK